MGTAKNADQPRADALGHLIVEQEFLARYDRLIASAEKTCFPGLSFALDQGAERNWRGQSGCPTADEDLDKLLSTLPAAEKAPAPACPKQRQRNEPVRVLSLQNAHVIDW